MAGVNSVTVVLLLAYCCCLGTGVDVPNLMYAPHHPPFEVVQVPYNVSAQCTAELASMFEKPNLVDSVLALDAFGKPAAGFLAGNWAWLGHYDQCTALKDHNYCLTYMQINGTDLFDGNSAPVLPGTLDDETDESEGVNSLFEKIQIRWGICPPASCNSQDVKAKLYNILEMRKLFVGIVNVEAVDIVVVICDEHPTSPHNAGFICTVLLCWTIGALMLVGALYDVYLQMKVTPMERITMKSLFWPPKLVEENTDEIPILADDLVSINAPPQEMQTEHRLPAKLLLCFAFNRNLAKLFNVKQSDSSISCLNGIRVISMTWVILGHSVVFATTTGTVANFQSAANFLSRFGFQAVANAYLSVDSFFFLSGFLLAYISLSRFGELKTVKRWGLFYFHRYWRLTPLLAFVILLFMYVTQSFGSGPVWQSLAQRPLCPKYWWTNLLYINNFWPVNFADECIGWVWYLANDMQFFIISPLFLAPLYYCPIAGGIILLSTLIASFIATGVIIGVNDFPLNVIDQFTDARPPGTDYMSMVYGKPYCRIAPYLVGIALGYAMYRIGKRRVKMPPMIALIGWISAAVVAVSVVYGLYPSYHHTMTGAAQVIYGSVSRGVWAVALSWVVFACKYGYGGWINTFLSWDFWVPLGRVTYGAYLIHPIVLESFYFSFEAPVFLSEYLVAFYFASIACITYFIAVILALAIEYPFANLEKLLFSPPKRQSSKKVTKEPQDQAIETMESYGSIQNKNC